MSERTTLQPGQAINYATRTAAFGKTYLFFEPYFDANGVAGEAFARYRYELVNQPDHNVTINADSGTIKIDISRNAGSLVSVHNEGGWPFKCWTDY